MAPRRNCRGGQAVLAQGCSVLTSSFIQLFRVVGLFVVFALVKFGVGNFQAKIFLYHLVYTVYTYVVYPQCFFRNFSAGCWLDYAVSKVDH
eukprot:12416693-Karenia_brevis.AAC.1